ASVATQTISPSASNFGAKARPSSTSSVEPRGAKGESSSDKKNLAQKPKLSSAARADGPAIARYGARRVGRSIGPLEAHEAPPALGMTFGYGARPGAVAAAQRSVPRTMVMKRT